MKKPDSIIFHCSASTYGDAELIRKWHLARGFRDVGYHFIMLNGKRLSNSHYDPQSDGLIELGRPLDKNGVLESWEVGAHALGYNDHSIGVCFVGYRYFTNRQILYGAAFLAVLAKHWSIPVECILGHRETGANKECPTMDEQLMRAWVRHIQATILTSGEAANLSPWDYIEIVNRYVLEKELSLTIPAI